MNDWAEIGNDPAGPVKLAQTVPSPIQDVARLNQMYKRLVPDPARCHHSIVSLVLSASSVFARNYFRSPSLINANSLFGPYLMNEFFSPWSARRDHEPFFFAWIVRIGAHCYSLLVS